MKVESNPVPSEAYSRESASLRECCSICRPKLMLAMLLLLFLSGAVATEAGGCPDCERHAAWPIVSNPHVPPDYDERFQDWSACMDEHLEGEYLSDDLPEFIAAVNICEETAPAPAAQSVADPGSIANKLFGLFKTECLGLLGFHPEYVFLATFEAGLGGTEVFVHRGSEHLLRSRLSLELWYDGDERLFVKKWETNGSLDTIGSHYRRMFKNRDAVLRDEVPLEDLLWEFEQKPVSCAIQPEEITVRSNETREITLAGFSGRSGPSKSFNRIIVKVDEGEILNGETLDSDPDARVFKIGDGNVTVNYKTPDPCPREGDTIYVYNSCDIAKTSLVPLSKTTQRDEIASAKISCEADLIADITASVEWELKGESSTSYDVSGSSEFSIHGQMLIESGGGTAVITRYVPSDLELVTSYQEEINHVSPDDGCPALATQMAGGDTQTLGAVEGLSNSMAVYHQAGPMSGTYEVMLLSIPPTEVHGKKQRSSSCGQPECLCRRYKPYERQVTIGRVGLRFPAGADGEMTGSRTWESHHCGMSEWVGFSVNEALGMVEFDPSTEGGDPNCTVRVTASWSFRPIAQRRP